MLLTSWNSFTIGTCLLYFKILCRIRKQSAYVSHYPTIWGMYSLLSTLLKADLFPNGASLQCNSGCKWGREGGSHLKHSPYGPLCTVTCKMRCEVLNMVRMLMSSRPLFWKKNPFSVVIDWNTVLFICKVQILFFLLCPIIIYCCACLCVEVQMKVWVHCVHIIPPITNGCISVHSTILSLYDHSVPKHLHHNHYRH